MTGSPAWFDRPEFAAFEEIWFVDFEFISRPGEHPDVLCLCAYEIRTGRRIQLWEDQLGPAPPYRTDDRALFVCFAATAECACHLALGWPLPSKVLDLSPMFRCYINGRVPPPEGKGLVGALRHFGLDTAGEKYKEAMRTRILQGRPYSAEEIAQILEYCMSDVVGLPALLERLLPHVDLDIALHWGEFAAVSAAMEHRGVPIDMEIARQLQDKDAWAYVRDAIVPRINPQYGVYVQDAAGEWSFNTALFEAYCARAGIAWPRHEDRQARPAQQDLRQHGQGLSADRIAAPTAPHPQQDAQGQARDRRRRAQPHGAVAVRLARPGARSRKPPSGFSVPRCGCGS